VLPRGKSTIRPSPSRRALHPTTDEHVHSDVEESSGDREPDASLPTHAAVRCAPSPRLPVAPIISGTLSEGPPGGPFAFAGAIAANAMSGHPRFGGRMVAGTLPANHEEDIRMGILGWIILGLLAGAIAKAILPGDDPGGIIVTMIIGIVGALLGGLIASALDIGDLDEFFDIGTWVIAILGSLLLLVIYRAVVGRRATGV
jgi:uncharacterized membrane protein YeaQ/YmgE (transglycosylase-associated protein family)